MSGLPRVARLYVLVIVISSAVIIILSGFSVGNNPTFWITIIAASAGIAILDAIPIDIFGEQIEITISDSVKLAEILLFPAPIGILSTFLGTLFGEVPANRAWFKKVFNVAEMTVSWTAVALVFQTLHQPDVGLFDSIQNIAAILIAGSIVFVANTVLVSLVVSLTAGNSFRYVWLKVAREVIWFELSMVPLGAFVAVLWQFNPVTIILTLLPLLVVRHSYRIANDLQTQTREALSALVRVIDERDHHTFHHSEQVSSWAASIANQLDLPQEEIETIASAALVHDLGKVGMADDILFSTKLLNPEERKSAEEHAEVGALLLSRFPLFDKGAFLVRHHHERYDGKGYPDGLMRETIPIGARIISVADAYQAMTEERPYRHALSKEEAVAQLLAGSGSQFDPLVVQALVQVLQKRSSEQGPAVAQVPRFVEAE